MAAVIGFLPGYGPEIRDAQAAPSCKSTLTAAFPGLTIFITVLGMNLLGDFLQDHLDPHLRNRMQ